MMPQVRATMLSRLEALPPLSPETARRQAAACKACGAAAAPFDVVDLNKLCSETDPYAYGIAGIPVIYHRCGCCGLLFTPFFDDWSAADFAAFIYNADYVKVDGAYVEARPTELAALVAARAAVAKAARVLDYGSGAGVFAERLAAHGFADVASYDPFSSPARPRGDFDLVTCFEVIEHTVAPRDLLQDVAGLLRPDGCVLLSTGIQPDDIGARRASWWYVGPRNGHATIFSLDALALLGAACGLTLHVGGDLLGFTRGAVSDRTRAILSAGAHPYVFALLTAPDGAANGWHGHEGEGVDAFRWTGADRVGWTLALPATRPCRLRAAIPMRIEIVPGFADRAWLEVDGEMVPLRRDGPARLVAECVLHAHGPGVATLRTPPPVRPADLAPGPDHRPLGLAVPTRAAILAGG
jgi:2-polyprenyl-6-hydroxyphenyl methylase/3-demethylubiquinone-9 3-methyltransferase